MTALKSSSLKNHFLIAMPGMVDPNFAHSITYICEHNDDGAMGIVVNRPMELTVADILSHLHIRDFDDQFGEVPVLCGGPVQMERGFVLHRTLPDKWDTTMCVEGDICLTTSRDILVAIAHHQGPDESVIALGYAGWSAGQLDNEMAQNAWLSVKANPDIIFATPFEQRWQAAASLLGVDMALLSAQAGHA